MTIPAATESDRSAAVETLHNYVGGRWVASQATESVNVHNPAFGKVIAKTPLSTRADLDLAVAAATKAFPAWRDTPVVQRARTMFKFVQLLEEHFEEIARTVTTEHGKTIDESRGSVRRGIECVEVACGAPSLMMGYGLEQIAITGLSPEAEPEPADLARVIQVVKNRGVTTIFYETLVSPRIADTVARETGAKTAVLDPIEGLTPAEIAQGEDYFTRMRANLHALEEGLGCHPS